jgi:hypothetical protein
MVHVVRGEKRIDNQIVENMKVRGSNTHNIKTQSKEGNITGESGCWGGGRENCLRELSLTQSIIDNVRGGERVTAKPCKTALVKLNSVQDLCIPRKSNVKTINHRSRVLDKYDVSGEAATPRRSSTA